MSAYECEGLGYERDSHANLTSLTTQAPVERHVGQLSACSAHEQWPEVALPPDIAIEHPTIPADANIAPDTSIDERRKATL